MQQYGHIIGIYRRSTERRKEGGSVRWKVEKEGINGGERKCKEAKVK